MPACGRLPVREGRRFGNARTCGDAPSAGQAPLGCVPRCGRPGHCAGRLRACVDRCVRREPGSGGRRQPVTYAMEPGGYANYILPVHGGCRRSNFNVYNVNDFQYLLYRPLYWSGPSPLLQNPARAWRSCPSTTASR